MSRTRKELKEYDAVKYERRHKDAGVRRRRWVGWGWGEERVDQRVTGSRRGRPRSSRALSWPHWDGEFTDHRSIPDLREQRPSIIASDVAFMQTR